MFISSHGQCDYVLLTTGTFASGAGLEVHIRTTRVDKPNMAYSYVSGVALRIGVDTIEVSQDGSLLENGNLVSSDDHGSHVGTVSGFVVSKSVKGTHNRIKTYTLDLGSGKSIELRVNTKSGIITVDIDGIFADIKGLLGAYDAKGMIARDGVTDLTGYANSYVESWQVNASDPKLFQDTNRYPQFPNGCAYESDIKRLRSMDQQNLRGEMHRRLTDDSAGVSLEVAQKACEAKEGQKLEFCIADVMATGDLDLPDDAFYN